MKISFIVLATFFCMPQCLAQDSVITKKSITGIFDDIRSDNIISFYKKHPLYDTILNIYLEIGKQKEYNAVRSNPRLYKENERLHKKNIFRNFMRFKDNYTDAATYKDIKINWPETEIQDIFLKKPRSVNNDYYLVNKHLNTTILVLLLEKNSRKQYVVETEIISSISGKFISFYIEKVYTGFTSLKKFLVFEKAEAEKEEMISVSTKTIQTDPPDDPKTNIKFVERIYGNKDKISFTIKFIYEQKQGELYLRNVIKSDDDPKAVPREKRVYIFNTDNNLTFSFDDHNTGLYWFMYQKENKIHVFSFDEDYSPGSFKEFDIAEIKN